MIYPHHPFPHTVHLAIFGMPVALLCDFWVEVLSDVVFQGLEYNGIRMILIYEESSGDEQNLFLPQELSIRTYLTEQLNTGVHQQVKKRGINRLNVYLQ